MKHYYMFNKPFGCVTAHRDDRFPVVMDYFRSLENDRLSPVGRLDRETEGLLMITDDGIWNHKMTNPAFHVPKTYEFAALRVIFFLLSIMSGARAANALYGAALRCLR